jgi:hypothetical protein
MLFADAVRSLVSGSYVTRTSWQDGSYLVMMPGMQYIWKVSIIPNPAAGNWLPMMDDLLGSDWEVKAAAAPEAMVAEVAVEAPAA